LRSHSHATERQGVAAVYRLRRAQVPIQFPVLSVQLFSS
jgi:hypothetical protein